MLRFLEFILNACIFKVNSVYLRSPFLNRVILPAGQSMGVSRMLAARGARGLLLASTEQRPGCAKQRTTAPQQRLIPPAMFTVTKIIQLKKLIDWRSWVQEMCVLPLLQARA